MVQTPINSNKRTPLTIDVCEYQTSLYFDEGIDRQYEIGSSNINSLQQQQQTLATLSSPHSLV